MHTSGGRGAESREISPFWAFYSGLGAESELCVSPAGDELPAPGLWGAQALPNSHFACSAPPVCFGRELAANLNQALAFSRGVWAGSLLLAEAHEAPAALFSF